MNRTDAPSEGGSALTEGGAVALPPSVLVVSRPLPTMPACLGLVVNRVYRIQPGGRATPIAVEAPVLTEPTLADSRNPNAQRRLVDDAHTLAIGKPLTDVLVRGTAYARGGSVVRLDTGVQVGRARKAVRVVGDRRVEVQAGGVLAFSAPESFAEMPVTWDRAYGGRDLHAEQLMQVVPGRIRWKPADARQGLGALAYPRNGAGCGYFLDVDRDRLHGTPAPNLEDPTDPVTPERLLSQRTTDWIDRPVAACYEAISMLTFPRATFLIPPAFDPPERPLHELATGAVLREDLTAKFDLFKPRDPRVFNCAPAGLAVCRLAGGERVSLWNLHRRHERLELDLPDDRPKLALDLPGVGTRELEPFLATVLIEPDLDRVTLTWAGVMPVAMPYPEEMTRSMPRHVTWRRAL